MSSSNPSEKLPFKEQLLSLDSRYWIVNVMEMLERLAYYGVRAVIPIYMVLAASKGGPEFTHIQKGIIFFWWAGVQSILPILMGGYADRYGHKKTVALAIIVKIVGYVMMAKFMSFGGFMAGCLLLAAGTAIFKPGVQGTLAITLKSGNASMGWGVFYQLVNVGGFLGPVLAGVLRVMDWEYVFYSCAAIVALNFLWLPFYKEPTLEIETRDDMADPIKVFVSTMKNLFLKPRVLAFCLLFSGFWLMFHQFFDLLPNFIDDWVDTSPIIATVGDAFSTATIPTLLAGFLALIAGFVVAAVVFLSTRPDRRPASEVPAPAYIVVSLGLMTAAWTVLAYALPEHALWLAPVIGLAAAAAAFATRFDPRFMAWAAAAITAVFGFILMRGGFIASSAGLTNMAAKGGQINPEYLLNLNPGLIVFGMIFFAYLTSFMKPLTSIIIGMAVATLGAYVAGSGTVGWICVVGILVFSVGEMLSSPKKNEYLASLAEPGQEGMYMGFANFPSAIGWMAGSVIAGALYEKTGDKVNLARDHLANHFDVAKDSVEVAARPEVSLLFQDQLAMSGAETQQFLLEHLPAVLPKAEVVPLLGKKLGTSTLETQQFLYETYDPSQVWVVVCLIGVGSMVGMLVYDYVIRKSDAKQAPTA